MRQLLVLRGHQQIAVQDLGRPGYAHLGVGRAGPADRAAFTLANRLVGDPPGNAVLEVTNGGLTVRTTDRCHVALTGADPGARVSPVDGDRFLAVGSTAIVPPEWFS